MQLSELKKNTSFQILHFPNREIRSLSLRIGLCEGLPLRCSATLPGGPVVIAFGTQEVAIGHGLAIKISVTSKGGF